MQESQVHQDERGCQVAPGLMVKMDLLGLMVKQDLLDLQDHLVMMVPTVSLVLLARRVPKVSLVMMVQTVTTESKGLQVHLVKLGHLGSPGLQVRQVLMALTATVM